MAYVQSANKPQKLSKTFFFAHSSTLRYYRPTFSYTCLAASARGPPSSQCGCTSTSNAISVCSRLNAGVSRIESAEKLKKRRWNSNYILENGRHFMFYTYRYLYTLRACSTLWNKLPGTTADRVSHNSSGNYWSEPSDCPSAIPN